MEALDSLLSRSHNLQLDICLSVQAKKDEILLRASYPDAIIFYPDLTKIEDLKNQPRYRSAIHSEIVNQAWSMKTDSDFAIMMDNDVLLFGEQQIEDVLTFLQSSEAVIIGTSYPRQNILSKALGYKDYKPPNVPNIIFTILDLSYYKKIKTICNLPHLLRQSDNPIFDQKFPRSLQGSMIDTAAELYLLPILDKKKYLIFSCTNTFHRYYPGSIKNFLLGGYDSPEIYFSNEVDITIHHFKKLSSPNFKNNASKKVAYETWREKVMISKKNRNY